MRDICSPGRPSDTFHGVIVALDQNDRALGMAPDGRWAGCSALVKQAQNLVAARAWLVAFGADGLTVDTALFVPGGHGSFSVASDAVDPTAAVAVMSVVCGPGVTFAGDIPDKRIVNLQWLVAPEDVPDVIHEDLAGMGAIGVLLVAGVIGHGIVAPPAYPPGTSIASIASITAVTPVDGQSRSLNPFTNLGEVAADNISAVLDNPDAYAAAHPNG